MKRFGTWYNTSGINKEAVTGEQLVTPYGITFAPGDTHESPKGEFMIMETHPENMSLDVEYLNIPGQTEHINAIDLARHIKYKDCDPSVCLKSSDQRERVFVGEMRQSKQTQEKYVIEKLDPDNHKVWVRFLDGNRNGQSSWMDVDILCRTSLSIGGKPDWYANAPAYQPVLPKAISNKTFNGEEYWYFVGWLAAKAKFYADVGYDPKGKEEFHKRYRENTGEVADEDFYHNYGTPTKLGNELRFFFPPPPPSRIEIEPKQKIDLLGVPAKVTMHNININELSINCNAFGWLMIELGFRLGYNKDHIKQIRENVPEQYQQDFDDGTIGRPLKRQSPQP